MVANNKRISPIQGPERHSDSPPLTKRELDEIIDSPFSTSYTYASADPNGSYTIPRLGRRFPEPDTSWWTTTTTKSLTRSKLPWFCCAVLFAALLVLVNAVHNQSCPQEQEKNASIGIAENTGADHLQLGSATENADLQPVLEDIQKAMIPMPLPPYEMCQHLPLSAIAFEVDDDVADFSTNTMDGHEQNYSNRSHANVNLSTTNSSTAVDFPLPSLSPSENNFKSSNTTDHQILQIAFGFGQAHAKLGPWGKELDVKFKYKVPYFKFQFNLTTALWLGDF